MYPTHAKTIIAVAQKQIAKAPSRWAVGKAQPVLGSPLAVCYTTRSERRRPFHVNEFSDVVKHNKVLYKMKFQLFRHVLILNAYLEAKGLI